jgi:hypothetical protein
MPITARAVLAPIASVAGGLRLAELTSAAARRRWRASAASCRPLREAPREGGAGCWPGFGERAPPVTAQLPLGRAVRMPADPHVLGPLLRSARPSKRADDRRRRSLIVRERARRAADRRHPLLVQSEHVIGGALAAARRGKAGAAPSSLPRVAGPTRPLAKCPSRWTQPGLDQSIVGRAGPARHVAL